jgi:hypothetical protein
MVRPATVRCRGGADSCRARVSLAGGASDKRVVIRLPDTHLRLLSMRPNRRSLRGAYGLFGQRLRAGGSEYVFRLNAAQSIRPGAYLIVTFSGKPARLRWRPVGVWARRQAERTRSTVGSGQRSNRLGRPRPAELEERPQVPCPLRCPRGQAGLRAGPRERLFVPRSSRTDARTCTGSPAAPGSDEPRS